MKDYGIAMVCPVCGKSLTKGAHPRCSRELQKQRQQKQKPKTNTARYRENFVDHCTKL
jgi:hypothetical protein